MRFLPRIMVVSVLAAFANLTSGTVSPSRPQRSPQPVASPNAPNPNYPQGMNGPGPKPPDQKQINRQTQEEVKADAEKLYSLAAELKDEVQKSDANNTLSMSVVKKAQLIEKLAKHIKDRAKG